MSREWGTTAISVATTARWRSRSRQAHAPSTSSEPQQVIDDGCHSDAAELIDDDGQSLVQSSRAHAELLAVDVTLCERSGESGLASPQLRLLVAEILRLVAAVPTREQVSGVRLLEAAQYEGRHYVVYALSPAHNVLAGLAQVGASARLPCSVDAPATRGTFRYPGKQVPLGSSGCVASGVSQHAFESAP